VKKPLLGIAATLVATIGAPRLAAAQTPRDALVQAPAFAKPERGSLTGALANLSFGAADVSRGAYSLPLPLALPSERGGVLASVVPTYSPDAGISEWGAGWSVGLSIQRYRVLGDVDYATDDFTSPWGRLVAGNDGYFYPSGLASPLRLKQLADGWEAIGPDGTLYEFAQLVDTTEGTYAWYLTSATTIFGDQTAIEYETNAGGRPFVKHVFYGGREDPTAYRADFEYTQLATALHDFRSGADLVLDRRVSAVAANVKHRERGSYQERWRYAIAYADSPFGPGFYLDMLTRTFASGESEPPLSYDYDLGELQTERGLEFRTSALEPAPVIDAYLSAVGDLDGLQSNRAAVLDIEEDGVSELEYVYDYSLASYSSSQGWTLTPLPPPTGEVDSLCRPGESTYNGPRTLVRLQGSGGPVSVLAVDAFWDTTEVVVCDRAGVRQHSAFVEGSWVLGANTKIVDLNRDDKPDLLRLDIDGYHILENTSDDDEIRFAPRPGGVLEYEHGMPFEPDATWAHDLNGDGNPDLLGRTSNRISVWYGRGRFRFDEREHAYPFINLDGSELFDLTSWEIAWVDANNDGLTDALLSVYNEGHLFVNEGTHFAEVRAGAFDDAWDLGWLVGGPVVGDHHGHGETEVAYSGVDGSYSFALTRPSVGLLTRVDDGRGNVVEFGYGRMDPHAGLRRRAPVLRTMTTATGGYDNVSHEYRYSEPVLHGVGRFLIGYGRTEYVGPQSLEVVTFEHSDDLAGVVTSSTSVDARTPHLSKFSATVLETWEFAGLQLRRTRKEMHGLCAEDDAARCASGDAVALAATKEVLDYEGVCATRTMAQLSAGTLEHVVQLAAPARLATALHCTAASDTWIGLHSDTWIGLHSDPPQDFTLRTSSSRDDFGQVTSVYQHGKDDLVAQEAGYDPGTHRLAWLRSPGGGTRYFSFDPDTGGLREATAADGVRTRVARRDPVTEAIEELVSDRGTGGVLTSSYRFDGLERLRAMWANYGGSSEASPFETIAYQYPTFTHPGMHRVSTLTDARTGARADTVAWQYPDGRTLGGAARHGDVWIVSGVSTSSRNDLRVESRWRGPMPGAQDPETATYASLVDGSSILTESRMSSFGHPVSSWNLVQSGVVSTTAQSLYLEGDNFVTESLDGGSFTARSGQDVNGLVAWVEDQTGSVTSFRYDALGRIVAVSLPDGSSHRVQYDGYGRPAAVARDGVGSIAYRYNGNGLVEAKEYYDKLGVLIRTLELSYDDAGRAVEDVHVLADTSEGSSFRYHFDGELPDGTVVEGQRGYLTSVTGDDYEFSVLRNPDGSAASTRLLLGGWMRIDVAKSYTVNGSLAGLRRVIERVADGKVVDDVTMIYDYDAGGRLAGIQLNGSEMAALTYDDEGRLDVMSFGTHGRIEHMYDSETHAESGFRRRIGGDSAGWGSSVEWGYDKRGLVAHEVFGFDDRSWRRDYGYDARAFLTSASDVDSEAVYSYDASGLVSSIEDDLGSRQPVRTGAVASVGEREYAYDSLGRVTSVDGSVLEYGADGQLARALVGAREISFLYDEVGNRVLKRVNGAPEAGFVAGGYLTNDGFVEPVRIAGRLVGVVERGSFRLVATDTRGTVVADEDGAVRLASPYGTRVDTPGLSAALDFVEKGLDPDLGTVRMGLRDYDPYLGQFQTPDPLFLEAVDRCATSPVECNLYGYARNNPLSFVDPSGTDARRAGLDAWRGRLVSAHRSLHDEYKKVEYERVTHDPAYKDNVAVYGDNHKKYVADVSAYYEAERIYRNDQGIELIARVQGALVEAAALAVSGAVVLEAWVAYGAGAGTAALAREVGNELWSATTGLPSPFDIKDIGNMAKGGAKAFRELFEACTGTSCFTEDVGVLTADGLVSIKDVRAGDKVLSVPEGDAEAPPEYRTVLRKFERGAEVLVDVVVTAEDGVPSVISGTPEHPVYVVTRGEYAPLSDLLPGERLRSADGGPVRVLAVLHRSVDTRVYNLEVEGNHTFFVSALGGGATSFLVHNTCCGSAIVEKITGKAGRDFDQARREGFERAGMLDPDDVKFTKVDPATGTVVEFKGPGGAKVAYDSPHPSEGPGHDMPHVGWQTAGKRGTDGAARGNITYDGPQHPHRSPVKGEGAIE
jgi:RHS repeat-associated protein